jgi:ATP-dependent helicase/nuclease subunit A
VKDTAGTPQAPDAPGAGTRAPDGRTSGVDASGGQASDERGRHARAPDDATRAQIGAADPGGSVWLAANAGSGKTRVLTNRVAWLLLEGSPPERILCLTFTRAAAGEMQNRLFATLGRWALAPDGDLRRALRELGVPPGRVDAEGLRRARTLFAQAIETPGGLKIQTIHAFCAALLRRFPLEAGVSPAFAEMDETAAAKLHVEIFDRLAEREPAMVAGIARHLSDADPVELLAAVAKRREGFGAGRDEAALRRALEIGPADCEASLREGCIDAEHLDLLARFGELCGEVSGKTAADLGAAAAQVVLAAPGDRLELLTPVLLTKQGEVRSPRWPAVVKAGGHPELLDAFARLAARLRDTRARIAALGALEHALALHAFAPRFCEELAAAKEARGWLDYDDLISRARHLLRRSDLAQWVLWKLDGGIDHILVDEAQDTSRAQWSIVEALAGEFGAGEGARDVRRTLFVVGDRKQSIYGFQGADPEAFQEMRARFEAMLGAAPEAGPPLRDHALLHSFRSAPAILRAVDATFAATGRGAGPAPAHIAFAEKPGRVDLWPVIRKSEDGPPPRDWRDPVDRPGRDAPEVVMAGRIARQVRAMLDGRAPVTVREGAAPVRRAMRPEDVLILFQRRGPLFYETIRACKAEGLDLAGADRLRLLDDLAVRDLCAALAWSALPEDCLSLAALLRSPLCGLSEDALFRLAHGRTGSLWRALRESGEHDATVGMLGDLLKVSDYLRPYEMLKRILVRHDGRRRLVGRLGVECAEAIDGLLHQALAYEALEVPSLDGFLGWLAAKAPELKRESFRGAIRVMTVHGAKGLEAPVVILPETMVRDVRLPDRVQCLPCGTPVWMPPKAQWSPALQALAAERERADREERDRLLYVAMTRAECWLIAGAAGKEGQAPEDSWWRAIEAGLLACGAQPLALPPAGADPGGEGLRLEEGDWSPVEPETGPAAAASAPGALPGWARGREAPAPATPPPPRSPSELGGAKILPGEHLDALEREAALRRGSHVHLLLERLPALPPARWEAAAPLLLEEVEPLHPGDDPEDALEEARAVLDSPDLAPLFGAGTLAEVPFSLPAADGAPAFSGVIDRLVVGDGEVLVVDYKTNAVVPARPEDTPEGLLRQMAAYRAAMRAVYPGRRVAAAILWTAEARLARLPDPLLDRAWAALLRGDAEQGWAGTHG